MGHGLPNSSTAQCKHALIVFQLPTGRTYISKAMLAKIMFSLREASMGIMAELFLGWQMIDASFLVRWSVSELEILVTRMCIRGFGMPFS